MKKIIPILLAFVGFHTGEAIFKGVSTLSVLQDGKHLNRIDIEKNNNLAKILNQVTLSHEKKDSEKIACISWDCRLMINKKGNENLWLYSSETGYLQPLTMQKKPLYQLKNFQDFNKTMQINKI